MKTKNENKQADTGIVINHGRSVNVFSNCFNVEPDENIGEIVWRKSSYDPNVCV